MLTFNNTVSILPSSPTTVHRYKAYSLPHLKTLPQLRRLSEEQRFAMEVVANVFPFKSNNYVIDELINWDNVPDDPMFALTFPQRGMLSDEDFETMADVLRRGHAQSVPAHDPRRQRRRGGFFPGEGLGSGRCPPNRERTDCWS